MPKLQDNSIVDLFTDFDAGMTSDTRLGNFRYGQLVKNFDAHTYSHKLVPFRSSESGDSAASTSQKQNFCIALRTGTTYSLYALGVVSGTAKAEILYKDLSTGASNDLGDNGWATPSNNQSSVGSTSFNLFVYYKKTGLIYGARAGTHIWAFDPSGSAAFADTSHALTYTNIAQGLVHSKDDRLYIPYDNAIAKNDNGSWTDSAITIPSDKVITSICEYGNFIAIAAAPVTGIGNSVVYIWDREASLTTLSESIDWGEGNLQILENIEGHLIGISYVGTTASALTAKIVFREYSGSVAEPFLELISEAAFTTSDLPIFKQKVNHYLYFLMSITLEGTKHQGLWKIGRNLPSKPFALTFDRTPNNDTALTSGTLQGFFIAGDYVFLSYVSSAAYALSKTDDQANYNATAFYDTLIYTAGDPSITKKLFKATLMFEALASGASVTLQYKKDEETSFTTIFTHSTANSIRHSAINIESTGVTLPEFKEITFRIQSTKANITGLKIKCEPKDDDL